KHNHPLATPRKVHLLRSHRGVSATKRALVQEYTEANIPTCKQVRLFEIDYGGPSMMGCLEKDIRNKEAALWRFDIEMNTRRQRLLTYDVLEDFIACSCKKFEFEGYPCRHMLCWMRVEQVMLVPEKYVKKRWTKDAKCDLIYDTPFDFEVGESLQGRRGALMKITRELIDDASLTEREASF
ncbi:FAR1-related sequence 5, partial [Striga asiatica]